MGAKPSLKVKLKKRWRGITKLTLNNMAQDSSQVRELVAHKMHMMAHGLVARANLAKVALVTEDTAEPYFMNYVNLEAVNEDRFFMARFPKCATRSFSGSSLASSALASVGLSLPSRHSR
jgi:hypothetical protein